ncbi:hypothetical protein R1sor_014142 [Riccia sorocarpa]|uniref:Nuclear pore complex protein Nup85 n=1 Tax=Riccia sorocarpa TaxID=122646 RepID=A0ABD3H950_9MARC
MREIVADAAPDLGYSYRDSVIHSHCQDWLLRLELNLTDSEISLEAVKWAISELQWMEEQDLLSSSADGGGESTDLRVDLSTWRVMLIDAGGRMDETETSSGSEMRDRVGKFIFSDDLKEAVLSAAGGEAGRRMEERIDARLDIPDCVFLTKLISHCLLVSMDQSPSNSVLASLGSYDGNGETSDWMWLHKFFVRTILPGSDSGYNSLDWLVAYMTASRGTITKLVLRDLINQLQSGGDSPAATYLPLTGVLEYAALRDEAGYRPDVV